MGTSPRIIRFSLPAIWSAVAGAVAERPRHRRQLDVAGGNQGGHQGGHHILDEALPSAVRE
jgi:hypothetical protein